MPFDPAAGYPLDPMAELRARVRALERRLAANPGAQAGGGVVADAINVGVVGVNAAGAIAQGGPKVELTVPEGGGLVQVYGEADTRLVSLQPGLPGAGYTWAECIVVDDVWLGGDGMEGVASNVGHVALQVSLGAPWPNPAGTFQRIRTPGEAVRNNNLNYGLPTAGGGVLGSQWAKAGKRTFYLVVNIGGTDVTNNAGTVWQFANRRLMARVVQ